MPSHLHQFAEVDEPEKSDPEENQKEK